MINFTKYWRVYLLISAVVIGTGLYSLVRFGLEYSIDFKGGSIVEYRLEKKIPKNDFKKYFRKEKIKISSISINNKKYLVKSFPLDEKQEERIRKDIGKSKKAGKVELLRFETVGPSVGAETVQRTAIASLLATAGILLYMTFAFKKIKHGLAAVLAMFHDFLVLIGMYSLLIHFSNAEVDILFVTAVLTTMSFSVHDTIVVFDKIREYQKASELDISSMANKALTETMVRSVNNSLTIVLMLVPLVMFGGEVIRFFSAALLIGTISGTYSSPFVATPLLVFFERKRK